MVLPSNQTNSSVWTLIHTTEAPPHPCCPKCNFSQISLGAGGEGQEKEAGRGGAGGDDIKICIDFAYF